MNIDPYKTASGERGGNNLFSPASWEMSESLGGVYCKLLQVIMQGKVPDQVLLLMRNQMSE